MKSKVTAEKLDDSFSVVLESWPLHHGTSKRAGKSDQDGLTATAEKGGQEEKEEQGDHQDERYLIVWHACSLSYTGTCINLYMGTNARRTSPKVSLAGESQRASAAA